MHDNLSIRLRDALAEEEWSPSEIADLTVLEADQLLAKSGIEYSIEQLQKTIIKTKHEANRQANNGARKERINKALQEFSQSSPAARLRRNESRWYELDRSSSPTNQTLEFVAKSLDGVEAALRWFSRKAEGGALPRKILTEIEKHYPIRMILRLIDAFILSADFESAQFAINRLGTIKLVKAKYGSHLQERQALIETGRTLKERLTREPLEFVSQADFGRQVLPDKLYVEFVDRDTLFRSWLKEFANQSLVEQIKVGGLFQFRSTCSVAI